MATKAAHEWRGRALFPRIPAGDRRACAIATFCPCYAFGATYERAFSLKWYATVAHTLFWFVGMSATWITAAVIMTQCNKLTGPDVKPLPSGVSPQDMWALLQSNFTTGANGQTTNTQGVAYATIFSASPNNCTAVAEAYSAFGANLAADYAEKVAYAQCTARLAPALGGVCVISFLVLAYGAWRRTQLRRLFGLPGDACNDLTKWLCCTTCVICQEYRTMRMNDVQQGVWGHTGGEVEDQTGATSAPYVQMTTRADALRAQTDV